MGPLEEALAFLESSEKVNYAAAARKFGCDETTLRRRHQGKQRSRQEADSTYKFKLSKQQEKELVAYIVKLTARGLPPTLSMVKNFAEDIAKVEVGDTWPYHFVKRHRDVLGSDWFDGFDVARKRADNTSRYKAYFELVSVPLIYLILD
jgi:hypothetical protein